MLIQSVFRFFSALSFCTKCETLNEFNKNKQANGLYYANFNNSNNIVNKFTPE